MARIAAALLFAVSLAAQDKTGQAPTLDEKNYKQWFDLVRPTEEETKWEKLGWRTDLAAAAQEAKSLQRPILLWTMNGHPCGHT